ncbi:hypothetical protein JTE90_011919 [Oedothorax gibbosus]|uniref:Uncharacterized protein n=1 Tax=Oedothorax gibbosus TaxID=931172 RepID=A0AAV6V2V4_9ARAC|nr:hypothetical protein JTE90_011919 [Oedothorax gibbosus]
MCDIKRSEFFPQTTKHKKPPKERRPANVSISSVEASGMEKNISAVEELAGVELDHDYAISGSPRKLKRKYEQIVDEKNKRIDLMKLKAYDYIRKSLSLCLPHPCTVRRWYNVIDGRPGFTAEALSALKYRLDVTPYKVYFAIMFDEMAIKKHLSWDGNNFFLYSTLGADICSEESREAKEALVFMAIGLNVSWAISIAYFLVDGTSAQDKANPITQAINILHDLGGTVMSPALICNSRICLQQKL